MGITNWEEAGSERRGYTPAWRGPRLTSQAASQKKEKLVTSATHHVPDAGPGNSSTVSTLQHRARPSGPHGAGGQQSLSS